MKENKDLLEKIGKAHIDKELRCVGKLLNSAQHELASGLDWLAEARLARERLDALIAMADPGGDQ